jgi:hypothetical protein
MAKLMNAWPSTAHELESSRFHHGAEDAVNRRVDERLPFVRNENMVPATVRCPTARQVTTY